MSKTRSAAETHRAVADLIDAHPDLPPPFTSVYSHTAHEADVKWYLHINSFGDEARQREAARSIVRDIGGKWDKGFNDDDAQFTQTRDGMHMLVVVKREAVCERRVIGIETLTLPAVEATPERTVDREVVEWDCSPVLADEQVSK